MRSAIIVSTILPLLAAASPAITPGTIFITPEAEPAPLPFESGSPAPAPAALAPGEVEPPAGVTILKDSIIYAGSGCPQGTASITPLEDGKTVTILFDAYAAQTGPKFTPATTRKNCQLNFKIKYPSGFQYSILNTDYRGFADIEKGVTGTLKSTYYFSGYQTQTSTETNFVGPMTGDYLKHDEIENSSTVWAPCGEIGQLNINSQVRLSSSNSQASGLLTTDSIDTKFVQKLALKWQTCKPKKASGPVTPAAPVAAPVAPVAAPRPPIAAPAAPVAAPVAAPKPAAPKPAAPKPAAPKPAAPKPAAPKPAAPQPAWPWSSSPKPAPEDDSEEEAWAPQGAKQPTSWSSPGTTITWGRKN